MADHQPTNETWKPVPGYEDLYEVSDQGRVRSQDRIVVPGRGAQESRQKGVPYRVQGRILKPRSDRDGYQLVNLYDGGVGTTAKVHRLILEAFRGECPPGHQACHYDDDPSNNRLDNIRWGTPSENQFDRVRNGNHNNANKTHCPHGHEYTPENTRISRKGGRFCIACERAHAARRTAERRRKRAA